jgi:hypothetical protein
VNPEGLAQTQGKTIWVRVSRMPLGMMNKATGEAIGKEMGEFLAMDKDEDNTTVGQHLRIKVRIDIRKPLMRGVTLCVGKDEKPLWCPVMYEFLPDFCYTCGIIGHVDKACTHILKEGEEQLFSKKLRFIPERKRGDDGGRERLGGGRFVPSWRSEGNGGRSGHGGSGSRYSSGRSGSDAPSWRKDDGSKNKDSGEEVTSPIKQAAQPSQPAHSGRSLFQLKEGAKEDDIAGDGEASGSKGAVGKTNENVVLPMLLDSGTEKGKEVPSRKVVRSTFRRQQRTKAVVSIAKQVEGQESVLGRKRSGEEVLEDELGLIREEVELSNKRIKLAGLADQPCEKK